VTALDRIRRAYTLPTVLCWCVERHPDSVAYATDHNGASADDQTVVFTSTAGSEGDRWIIYSCVFIRMKNSRDEHAMGSNT